MGRIFHWVGPWSPIRKLVSFPVIPEMATEIIWIWSLCRSRGRSPNSNTCIGWAGSKINQYRAEQWKGVGSMVDSRIYSLSREDTLGSVCVLNNTVLSNTGQYKTHPCTLYSCNTNIIEVLWKVIDIFSGPYIGNPLCLGTPFYHLPSSLGQLIYRPSLILKAE